MKLSDVANHLCYREEELAATSARADSAEAKARVAQLEATQAQAALNEVSKALVVFKVHLPCKRFKRLSVLLSEKQHLSLLGEAAGTVCPAGSMCSLCKHVDAGAGSKAGRQGSADGNGVTECPPGGRLLRQEGGAEAHPGSPCC